MLIMAFAIDISSSQPTKFVFVFYSINKKDDKYELTKQCSKHAETWVFFFEKSNRQIRLLIKIELPVNFWVYLSVCDFKRLMCSCHTSKYESGWIFAMILLSSQKSWTNFIDKHSKWLVYLYWGRCAWQD